MGTETYRRATIVTLHHEIISACGGLLSGNNHCRRVGTLNLDASGAQPAVRRTATIARGVRHGHSLSRVVHVYQIVLQFVLLGVEVAEDEAIIVTLHELGVLHHHSVLAHVSAWFRSECSWNWFAKVPSISIRRLRFRSAWNISVNQVIRSFGGIGQLQGPEVEIRTCELKYRIY